MFILQVLSLRHENFKCSSNDAQYQVGEEVVADEDSDRSCSFLQHAEKESSRKYVK